MLVYLIKDIKNNTYKIGETTNLKKRFTNLKTSNINIVLIGVRSDIIESELHKYFFQYKLEREWFKFPEHISKKIEDFFKFLTPMELPDCIFDKNNIINFLLKQIQEKDRMIEQQFDHINKIFEIKNTHG